jgi:hypothetical protein
MGVLFRAASVSLLAAVVLDAFDKAKILVGLTVTAAIRCDSRRLRLIKGYLFPEARSVTVPFMLGCGVEEQSLPFLTL